MQEPDILISRKRPKIIMAKNHKTSRRRNRRGFVTLPVSGSVQLSTLASGIVITGDLIANLSEDFFAISMDIAWTIRDLTAGEGPLQLLAAHGDYTPTELKEYLDVDLSNPANLIAREQGSRKIRRVGFFSGLNSDEVLNDGQQIRTRLKFILNDGVSLNLGVHNQSGATLTTGATVIFAGQVYGRWLY